VPSPCYWSDGAQLWILSRYDDIVEAARDWQTFSSAQGNMIDELPGRAGSKPGTTIRREGLVPRAP
jgi:hypothetical protein